VGVSRRPQASSTVAGNELGLELTAARRTSHHVGGVTPPDGSRRAGGWPTGGAGWPAAAATSACSCTCTPSSATALSRSRPEAVAAKTVQQRLFGLPADFWERYRGEVEAITPAAMQATSKALLVDQPLQLVVLGRADNLEKELARRGPGVRHGPEARALSGAVRSGAGN